MNCSACDTILSVDGSCSACDLEEYWLSSNFDCSGGCECAAAWDDCCQCRVTPCACGEYDEQPTPKLDIRNWGDQYMSDVRGKYETAAWRQLDMYEANEI